MYPNILAEYWRYLSGSEQKVLDFILRQTIGFQKISDRISLSQFTKGLGGRSTNKGTGLSLSQVRRALVKLEEKGFIRVERQYRIPSKIHLVTELDVENDDEEEEDLFEINNLL
jgi:DNA-binding transcriptional ArsR family regulator